MVGQLPLYNANVECASCNDVQGIGKGLRQSKTDHTADGEGSWCEWCHNK